MEGTQEEKEKKLYAYAWRRKEQSMFKVERRYCLVEKERARRVVVCVRVYRERRKLVKNT